MAGRFILYGWVDMLDSLTCSDHGEWHFGAWIFVVVSVVRDALIVNQL